MNKQTKPAPPFRVFDSHVNIGSGEIESDPLKSDISPERILQLMLEANIERSLIFPASRPAGYAEANKEVASYVMKYPDRFVGFGRMRANPARSPRRLFRAPDKTTVLDKLSRRFVIRRKDNPRDFDEACREELRKCFEEYALLGIKVHPGEDGYPSEAILTTLQSYNKPILLHCGRGIDFARIENEIIKTFTMPVILAHMGGYPADRKLYLRALDLAKKYSHVYLNTSFVFYQYILELAMTTCPSKIVFGSDAPGVHPHTAVSAILSLRISDEVKQMVFWDNIARLLNNQ